MPDGDGMSTLLFELNCSCTDPDQCVLWLTHGNIDMPEDGDAWMWHQECYHCSHSQMVILPALHARRRFGPGGKNAKVCKRLTEFGGGGVMDEIDQLIEKGKRDIRETEALVG